jgi:hypothetical protein
MTLFQCNNEHTFKELRAACLIPRKTHARLKLQSIFAALQSTLSSYLHNHLSALSFDQDPKGTLNPEFTAANATTIALLMDWMHFTQTEATPAHAHFWTDVPTDLREYTVNRLSDIFHLDDQQPYTTSANPPALIGHTNLSTYSLLSLRDRMPAAPARPSTRIRHPPPRLDRRHGAHYHRLTSRRLQPPGTNQRGRRTHLLHYLGP